MAINAILLSQQDFISKTLLILFYPLIHSLIFLKMACDNHLGFEAEKTLKWNLMSDSKSAKRQDAIGSKKSHRENALLTATCDNHLGFYKTNPSNLIAKELSIWNDI